MTDANDLQISRNYKLFKRPTRSVANVIYKLVEIISYSNGLYYQELN